MTHFNRRTLLRGATAALASAPLLAGATAPAVTTPAAPAVSTWGPPPGVAKLNANENPFGPSPAALAAIADAARNGAYYVGPAVMRLKTMIAERHGLTPDHVSLSAGSSGVLTYLAVAKSKTGHILGPDLFWDTTAKAAIRQGGSIERLPKNESLAIDLDAMAIGIKDDTAMVQITNPNNPTGMVLDPARLRAFCIAASRVTTVLVDEAYNELTDDPDANSMVPLIKAGHDVLVARTFSKIYGLAGLRVGYMLSSPENAQLISTWGLGDYAMNQAGVAAAIASYNDEKFLAASKARIIEAREAIVSAVNELGLKTLPSSTNFVYVDLGDLNADAFRQAMAKQNVLIRGVYRDYTSHSRVSMGPPEAVAQYIAALPRALDEAAGGKAA